MNRPTQPMDLDSLRGWIGREERRSDFVHATTVAALAATLDQDATEPPPGSNAPPLIHWLCFPPLARASELRDRKSTRLNSSH